MLHDAYINMIASNPQFVVDDVLHKVVFLHLPEAQPGVAKADILKVVFCRGANIPLPLDVIARRFADEKGIHQEVNIVFDRLVAERLVFDAFERLHQFAQAGITAR